MKHLCVFVVIFFLAPFVFADNSPLLIRSVYDHSKTGATSDTTVPETIWTFKKLNENTYQVFAAGVSAPVLVMRFGSSNALEEVEKRDWSKDDAAASHGTIEKRHASIFLSEGYPVPYDYLAPFETVSGKVVIKRRAGGTVFSQAYEKKIEFSDFSEIKSGGFLTEGMINKYDGAKFRTVSIYLGEQLIAKQIWPENGNWWVYEETPGRKSWRME